MKTDEVRFVDFLQWALPRLGLSWNGFRKVRRQVIKRIARRIDALQLEDIDAYRHHLETHEREWLLLDRFCRITISRFYRDRRVFDVLAREGLAALLGICRTRAEHRLRCWSAGCGAGEEAYTLVLIWALQRAPDSADIPFSLIATDADPAQIARAEIGCYKPSSLKELPDHWRDTAFTEEQGCYCIKPQYRRPVRWVVQDLRETVPNHLFDLILCRNLAFTYFSPSLQREVLHRLGTCLASGGLLVIGSHELLPDNSSEWTPWQPGLPIYHKHS